MLSISSTVFNTAATAIVLEYEYSSVVLLQRGKKVKFSLGVERSDCLRFVACQVCTTPRARSSIFIIHLSLCEC